jgi:nitronate monooxygenase
VRSFGARLGIQVVNADAARRATNLGADFLICQGIEAGGHVESTTPLAQLLPEIVEAAQGVPVIAAGGLATGDDADRVLKAGAAGAMFGTRFVASEESRAHPIYKQRLVDSSETSLTYCFDGGWPNASHRVLVNQTLKDWEAAGSPSAGRPGEREILAEWEGKGSVQRYSDAAPQRGMSGAVDKMCLYAGTGCGRIDAILPAAEIMRRLSGFNFANPGRDPDRLK